MRADAVLAEATAPQPVVRKGCAAPNRVDKSDTLWQVMDGWRRKQVLGGELTQGTEGKHTDVYVYIHILRYYPLTKLSVSLERWVFLFCIGRVHLHNPTNHHHRNVFNGH